MVKFDVFSDWNDFFVCWNVCLDVVVLSINMILLSFVVVRVLYVEVCLGKFLGVYFMVLINIML